MNETTTTNTQETTSSRRGLLRLAGSALAGAAMLHPIAALAQTTTGDAGTATAPASTGTAAPTTGDMGTMAPATTMPAPASAPMMGKHKSYSASSMTNDASILNVALLLEFLEADFYLRVVAADTRRPYLHGRVADLARTLARDEVAHVEAVSAMIQDLGGTPIEKPTFQFPADTFISHTGFLTLAAALEETGVSAYLGAAPKVRIQDVLKFAASIYGIEARHAGLIHYMRSDMIAPRNIEMPITIEAALARANPFIVKDVAMPATTTPAT